MSALTRLARLRSTGTATSPRVMTAAFASTRDPASAADSNAGQDPSTANKTVASQNWPMFNFGLLATSSLVGIVWMASQCISKLEALTTQVDNLGVKLEEKIDHVEENLGVKIGHVEENLGVKIGHLDVKIDNVEKALTTRVDNVEANLNVKIGHVEKNLGDKIGYVEKSLHEKIGHIEKNMTDKR